MESGSRELVVDYMTPLDILFKRLHQYPSTALELENLLIELAVVTAILMDPLQVVVGGDLLEKIASAVRLIGSLILSFPDDFDKHLINKVSDKELNVALDRAFDAAKKTYGNWPDPVDIGFPAIHGLSFVEHLVENLGQLVKAKADALGPLKFLILLLQQKLHHLSCALMQMPEPRKEKADLEALIERTTYLAYESEHFIDSFLTKDIPMWYCMDELTEILEFLGDEITQLSIESSDIEAFVSGITHWSIVSERILAILNDTEMSKNLNEIFHHPDVIDKFEIRTRSLVGSYKERKKEVFLQLLHNASSRQGTSLDGFEYTSEMSKHRLKRSLRNLLKKRKFLIILEDVREPDALLAITTPLFHYLEEDRGLVLLTTPSQELATKCLNQGLYDIFQDRTNSTSQSNKPTKSQPSKPTNDDGNIVIGFKDEAQRILEFLTGGPKKLCIISITGMAGQGKTTLAKKLYRDPLVVGHFDTLLHCCVTQVYAKREMLLELLEKVGQHSSKIHNKNDVELEEMLHKTLKGRRFLIFLDDIWTIGAWDDLARCFADDKTGSRIMFTTRVKELASQAKCDSRLQPLNPLSDDESWELLRNKVFWKESCPLELLGVGRRIAKDCRGLPLSVVLIGGLLAKVEKKVDVWEDIAKTLTSRVLGDAEAHGQGAIELSYKHLPNSLKACFLYFGAFLEDREILVQKLVRLWIAEGFVKHLELKNLEDVAMDYLMDLVGRSLVTIAKEKSIGGVKSCRVHDLLREFCLAKARKEKFLFKINGYDEHFSSSNNSLDYGIDPNYSCSSTSITYRLYRLSIYSKRNHFVMLKPFGPSVRSLLFFPSSDMCPNYSYDISFIFHNFKLLKILDLEEINIGDSFKTIDVLVLLRYLAVQSDVDFIPSSIANLWKLETFVFKALSTNVVKVPDSIWDMDKLRHMHANGCVFFDLEPHRLENSSALDNLQTFSTPSLSYGDDMMKLLRLLRGIRKLKCIFLDSWNDTRDCNLFPELEFLNQLVSLKVFYNGEGLYPCEFNLPSNLKKLTLSNFCMPWCEISQLVALSNLEVLKLLDNAFEGEIWEMDDDQVFPKLKFLKMKNLSVVKWIAFDDHFPHLEHLILHKCERLEEIPPAIGDINTLRTIEVMSCSSSSAISAEKIRDNQLEYGNEITVHIHRMAQDSEASS